MKLIDKAALVAEIERIEYETNYEPFTDEVLGKRKVCKDIKDYLDTLEVKKLDEQKERMSECPYRQVGCTMYKGKILECNGACCWVVDYLRLKELKVKKGE